ncbi:hypothetical protein (nucleomorph) [Guillardia theta]|uniref:Uncharacterized protein n=1 Tax=Guillardia theta TaxID=55529 RepID=Q9SEA6_GUITH|nr:hypothetical protein GTHECHR1003 [Guillardia theta]AAF24210.1 hypothetical protein [Guillardia theta]
MKSYWVLHYTFINRKKNLFIKYLSERHKRQVFIILCESFKNETKIFDNTKKSLGFHKEILILITLKSGINILKINSKYFLLSIFENEISSNIHNLSYNYNRKTEKKKNSFIFSLEKYIL